MNTKRIPVADRYWPKVIRSKDGCWGWTGSRTSLGYGRLTLGGKRGYIERASRVSWMLHFGAIPEGMQVLHRCDNPPCSRPDHLFLGTQADNVADMWAKGRAVPPPMHFGVDAPRAKLTPDLVAELRRRRTEGIGPTRLAAEYGIRVATVYSILNRRYWRQVP